MGISLKDIFKNDEERLIEDRRKSTIKFMAILSAVILVLIIVLIIIRFGVNIDEQRRDRITKDIQNIQNAIKLRASQYIKDPSIGYPGYSLELEGATLNINGVEEEYRYGYYFLASGDLNQIATVLNLPNEQYIVNYDTGDVVNVTGIKYKGRRYHSVDDLLAIAAGKTPLSDSTIIIRSAADMIKLAQVPNGYFKLSSNIDMSEVPEFSTGEGWTPVSKFTGSFDGRGYTISNLNINRSTQSYVGLFGSITSTAKITNLNLENVNVVGSQYTGALVGDCKGYISYVHVNGGRVRGNRDSTGGLVGAYDIGQVTNCTVKADVDGEKYVGGAIGSLNGGTINRVSAEGNITATEGVGGLIGYASTSNATYIHEVAARTAVNGTTNLGGLIGAVRMNSSSDIEIVDSYARGSIQTGTKNVGGMIGEIATVQGTPNVILKNLYTTVTGIVIGNAEATGGFIGNCSIGNSTGITVEHCFWEKALNPGEELNSIGQSTGGITIEVDDQTSAEMRIRNAFTDWGFDTTWDIEEREDTPTLKWEQSYLKDDADEKK